MVVILLKEILIVEDDPVLSGTLAYNLASEMVRVARAASLEVARMMLTQSVFDLVLLDVNLPDGEGYTLCEDIKKWQPKAIIIFLTARDEEADLLYGYEVGAVDYIVKPFSLVALERKISAMLALVAERRSQTESYDDGRLVLDFSTQSASLCDQPLHLSALEFRMLKLFCSHPKQVLTRNQLLERLWDVEENYVDAHTLTSTVSRVRGKIEAQGDIYIKTVYGMGYQWMGGADDDGGI